MKKWIVILLIAVFSSSVWMGCSKEFWGGTATGAVGAGAAYEIQNKRQMDQLEEDYEEGKISHEEYEYRKKQIKKGSIVY